MTPTITRSGALVAVGVALLVGPALFPVQPMLYHYPEAGTTENATELRQEGYEIVAYGNLSARGQELYRRALREGTLAVPKGAGAPEFEYPTSAELGAADAARERPRGEERPRERLGAIVIERPPNADLPPAAEPVEYAEEIRERVRREREERAEERAARRDETAPTPGATTRTGTHTRTEPATPTLPSVEERRETIARYDLLRTRTELPPLTATRSLARLLVAMLGVVLVGVGGYRYAQP